MIIVREKNLKAVLSLMFVLSILAAQLGCDRKSVPRREKYSATRMLMGTTVQMDVCRDPTDISKIENAYKDIWERLEVISTQMNVLDGASDIAKVNNSGLASVSIAQDTYHVIEESIVFSRSTKGAFDVTVWPLMKLWRESERNNIFPDKNAISRVQSAVGSKNIQLLGNRHVKLLNKETKIDLGGIVKGYGVDEAARIFRLHGIMNFFIDAGGDIYAGGKNCNGEPWRIGIRDPRDRSKIIDIVNVVDKAVATSGDYEQYYHIGGQKWSHIINPITGYPQRDVISATVIAQRAIEADALATALCVLGGDLGTGHMDALKEPYASLIIAKQKSGNIKKFESEEYKKYKYKK